MNIDNPAPAPEIADQNIEREAAAARGPINDNADHMRAAFETGQVGAWCWDVPTNRIVWSVNLEKIHGRICDGIFDFFENDVHPDDRAGVRTMLQDILRSQKPGRVLYRLASSPDGEERCIEASAQVVIEDGAVARIVGVCRDVTEQTHLHRELRARARQQDAAVRLGERALTEIDLQKLFDEAAAVIAEIFDVELVKILELVPGDAELLLRAGVGWKPGLVGVTHVTTARTSHAGYTLASGGAVMVDNLQTETRFGGDALLDEHGAVSGISAPIAGRDGRAYGVLTAHSTKRRRFNEHEVAFLLSAATIIAGAIQRRQLDYRHEMMIRELRHRSGNLFAQLLALFSQTAKTSKNVPELVTKYEARVLALAHAHRLITEGGFKSASLTEILNTLLAPYLDRISISGPDVFLESDPTFGLSMAVHELTTNAAKFGALSGGSGHVEVSWAVDRTDRGLTLTFDWKECSGPRPKRVRRPGFGTKLIGMAIERQLNGEVQQKFGPGGLDLRLIVPLTHERWPGAHPPPMPETGFA